MIFTFIISIVITGLATVFAVILPTVTIASIPLVGGYISSGLVAVVSMFNAFLILFPFAVVVWHCFLWIILFESMLLIAKFFLGHHVPANMN